MGFDIYGIAATNKKGDYFRNNVWWWRPLWAYVCEVCGDFLNKEDIRAGDFNDCYQIDEDKARQIAERLFSLIEKKKVEQYSDEYSSHSDSQDYPFATENVKEFAEFCRVSGGFEIC